MRCVVLFLSFLLITFEAYALDIFKCERDHWVQVWKFDCNDEEFTCPLPEVKADDRSSGERDGVMIILFKDYAVVEEFKIDASGWQKKATGIETVYNRIEGSTYDFKLETEDSFLRLYPVYGSEGKMRADAVELLRSRGDPVATVISSWSCTEAY